MDEGEEGEEGFEYSLADYVVTSGLFSQEHQGREEESVFQVGHEAEAAAAVGKCAPRPSREAHAERGGGEGEGDDGAGADATDRREPSGATGEEAVPAAAPRDAAPHRRPSPPREGAAESPPPRRRPRTTGGDSAIPTLVPEERPTGDARRMDELGGGGFGGGRTGAEPADSTGDGGGGGDDDGTEVDEDGNDNGDGGGGACRTAVRTPGLAVGTASDAAPAPAAATAAAVSANGPSTDPTAAVGTHAPATYLSLHAASPTAIDGTVLRAVRDDDASLLRAVLRDVGVPYVLRHCMVLPDGGGGEGRGRRSKRRGAAGRFASGLAEEKVGKGKFDVGDGSEEEEIEEEDVEKAARDGGRGGADGGTDGSADAAKTTTGRTLFWLASYHGSHRAIDVLAEACLDHFRRHGHVSTESGPGGTADRNALRSLADLLSVPTSCGTTPLLIGAAQNRGGAVESLLRHGVDPNAPNRYGATAAVIAASVGGVDVLRALGRHPATDFNLADGRGMTPVLAACCRPPAPFRPRSSSSPPPSSSAGGGGGTPSTVGALRYLREYRRGIDRIVDFTVRNSDGYGCPTLAALHDRPDVVRYLSEVHDPTDRLAPDLNQRYEAPPPADSEPNSAGSDPAPRRRHPHVPPDGDPPIHVAARLNNARSVWAFLTSRNCDATSRNLVGRTVLHVAVAEKRPDVVRCIVDALSFPSSPRDEAGELELLDAEDATGMTPLFLACRLGYADIVRILAPVSDLNAMCHVDVEESGGGGSGGESKTAAKGEDDPAAEVEDAAEASATGGDGGDGSVPLAPPSRRTVSQPPLLVAAANDHVDCVMTLLSHGVDVDQTDGEGHTAISVAARAGYLSMCQVLLTSGADLRIRSARGGGTPL